MIHLGRINPGYIYMLGENEITSTLLRANLTLDGHCERTANKATAVVHNIFRGLSTKPLCPRQNLLDLR